MIYLYAVVVTVIALVLFLVAYTIGKDYTRTIQENQKLSKAYADVTWRNTYWCDWHTAWHTFDQAVECLKQHKGECFRNHEGSK